MTKKKFEDQDHDSTMGPMNSVSKDDALVWAGAPPVKHLSKLDSDLQREVRAKKQKAVQSTKKNDRRISKELIKHITNVKENKT